MSPDFECFREKKTPFRWATASAGASGEEEQKIDPRQNLSRMTEKRWRNSNHN
jgi:hypothetical protein